MRDVRVILVGPTGLERELRRDESVELLRARTPLDAVGELSDPIFDDSPARSVVVVSPSAEPSGEEPAQFIESLRLIDPKVTVLRMGAVAPGYDGVAGDAASLLRLIRDGSYDSPARPAPPVNGNGAARQPERRTPTRASAAPSPSAPSPPVSPGDDALVELLMSGEPIEPTAVALLRERADDDVRYEPGEGAGVPVLLGDGSVAGRLVSAVLSDEDLAPHAAWLGAWLRLAHQHRELRQAAFTDTLTGAWNRRYFERFLSYALGHAREKRSALTLMVFDIDNFKVFNDRYGHLAGDSILIETVKLLRSVIRPSDRVCRIGGDEFAVIFHEPEGPRESTSKHPSSVFAIAKRFQKQICAHRFPKLLDEAPGTLTISAGLATYPWDGGDAESLLDRADQLALQSKQQGKNAITLGPGAVTQCDAWDFDDR